MKSRYAFLCLLMITANGCSSSAGGDPKASLSYVKADIEARTTVYAADLDATAKAADHALRLLEQGVVKLQEAKAGAAGDRDRLKGLDEQISVWNEKVARLKELQSVLGIKKSGLEQFIRADLPTEGQKTEQEGNGQISAATLQADFARAEDGTRHLTVEILGAVVDAHNLHAQLK